MATVYMTAAFPDVASKVLDERGSTTMVLVAKA